MSPKSSQTINSASAGQWLAAIGLTLLGLLLASSCIQTWLSSQTLATNFISPESWSAVVQARPITSGLPEEARVGFGSVALPVTILILSAWAISGFGLARRSGGSMAAARWGLWNAFWWSLLGLWEWLWIAAGVAGWNSLASLLSVTPQLWTAGCLTGWITTFLCLNTGVPNSPTTITPTSKGASLRKVLIAAALYAVIYTAMNWRLYFNLLIPHGDSAMYEEHLWNLLHGKGFRSYLDQGLFLGEHIQFVHLFLIPLYLIWPSHLLLELCESTALALGAVPVFWLVRRQAHSDRAAVAAAIAYLLYAPMQFLDIEIDLKTFRPEAFGIPLLLLTLDQLDRRNLRGMLIGLLFTLTVKEDYAIVFGPLGVWIAVHEFRSRQDIADSSRRRWIIAGVLIAIVSVLYLWLATRVVMPWFRSGAEVHYARYFSRFGETPEQILRTMVTRPDILFNELFSIATILYALALLAPLAFLPLLSPGRLSVGLPLFGILCLNELAKDPRHQFHAPLVAIVFWAVAGSFPRATTLFQSLCQRMIGQRPGLDACIECVPRTLLWTGALTTGFFFSLGPLGIPFWDPGSSWNWQRLYGTSRRATMFAHVPEQIPVTSKVASTDFVHPRFTHYERSYDYSHYRRKVSGYEQRVPDDTDYIVIDTQHRYSEIKRPEQIPEYRDHPDQWELLPDRTEGFFIILRRHPLEFTL